MQYRDGCRPRTRRRMILEMTRKKQPKEHLVKVAKADRDWISPEVATELLKRASDGSKPIPWEDVKAELDEMDRLGV